MDIKLLSAAIALLPLIGVALALGRIASSAIDSSARNPSAKDDLFNKMMLGLAFTEAVALFALVVSILILFS
ncbi:MAG: F0F1 ATP synthase subunit C [Alphaproteobacteria bacterium]|nr:MAG: F0F1 ATP synthase subunit C [Alphaproteobacteria bacterium]